MTWTDARRWLLLFVLLGIVRGVMYAAIIPPWQGPDEPQHFEYVRLLRDRHRWVPYGDISVPLEQEIIRSMIHYQFRPFGLGDFDPSNPPRAFKEIWGREGVDTRLGTPPLYHLITGLPLYLPVSPDVTTQLYLCRGMSILMGALFIAVVFLIGWELFPQFPSIFLGATTFVLFLPMFMYIAAVVNSDNLANLIVALVTYLLVAIIVRGFSVKRGLLLALLIVAGIATKKGTLITIPLVVVAVPLYLGAQDSPSRWRPSPRLVWGVVGFVALSVSLLAILPAPSTLSGLLSNIGITINHYDSSGMFSRTLQVIQSERFWNAEAWTLYRSYPLAMFKSFWGMFGWLTIPLSDGIYRVLGVVSALSAVGVVLFASRVVRGRTRLTAAQQSGFWLLVAVLLLSFGAATLFSATLSRRPQGRYLFTALAGTAILFVIGIREITPVRFRRASSVVGVVSLMVFDLVALFAYIVPAYYARGFPWWW